MMVQDLYTTSVMRLKLFKKHLLSCKELWKYFLWVYKWTPYIEPLVDQAECQGEHNTLSTFTTAVLNLTVDQTHPQGVPKQFLTCHLIKTQVFSMPLA